MNHDNMIHAAILESTFDHGIETGIFGYEKRYNEGEKTGLGKAGFTVNIIHIFQ